MHILKDQKPPNLKDIDLVLALKGLSREKKHKVKQAEPMTPQILLKIRDYLDLSDPQDASTWALFTSSFWLMTRKSNMVPNSATQFDPSKQFTRGDVKHDKDLVVFRVKWSKTIQFGQRELIIPLTPCKVKKLCPVRAINNMIALNPAKDKDPLFINADGSPITYSQFMTRLRTCLTCAGLNAAKFATHSFRRGSCTFAFKARCPIELIRLQGDWQSESYFCYLQFPIQERAKVCNYINDLIELELS